MQFFRTRSQNGEKGFTLLELALVMFISAGTILMFTRFIKLYTTNAQYETTVDNLRLAQDALDEYYGLEGVYPCPADPTLGPGDEDYGVAQCRATPDDTAGANNCDDTPDGLICTNQFSRDGDGDGDNDIVMQGVLPFRTLGDRVVDTPFTEAYKKDGYGALLSYAVTEHMTNRNESSITDPANPHTGAIRIIDENRVNLTDPEDSAHMVVFSHGDNSRGGYTPTGDQIDNCMVTLIEGDPPEDAAPGPFTAGMEVETENCDSNDAIFAKGIRSLADGDTYNDDLLFYNVAGFVPIWRRALNSPDGESYIFNTNTGHVGVGTDTPGERLHVIGDMSAEQSAIADNYCDGNTGDCLDPDFIASSGHQCGPGEVAYGIQENRLACRPVEWVPPNKSCPATGGGEQRYIKAISNLGNLRCCTYDEADCCTFDGGTCTP
ncbi:MAG: type II secretion system protein [Alphaproteobacteria bacterium]